MYANVYDGVKESTATAGNGLTITLTQEAGFVRFSQAAAVSELVYYVIRNGSNFEGGIGTVQAGNTLDRTTPMVTLVDSVYDSSSPARITLAGNSVVAIAPSAIAINELDSKANTADVWNPDNDGAGSGLDADTLDTYEASAFPRKAEAATISGGWNYTTSPIITNVNPAIILNETDQAVGAKSWAWRASGGNLLLQELTDANGWVSNILTVSRSGVLTLTDKIIADNATVDAVVFPATQVQSANANTLDDYQEVETVVTIVCGTSGTITLDSGAGETLYSTKIGNTVHVDGYLTVASVSSPVGQISIDNLAFTAARSVAGAISMDYLVATRDISLFTFNSGVKVKIKNNTTTDGSFVADMAEQIKAGTAIRLSLTYRAPG